MNSKPTPRWTVAEHPDPNLAAVTEDMLYLSTDELHAIDLATGKTAWSASIRGGARIDATDSNVFVRRPNESSLRCLATFDGVEMWETTLSGRFQHLLANERNAIASTQTDTDSGLLEAVNIDTGGGAWSMNYAAPASAITPLPQGIIFIDGDQRVSLIDEQGGIERWSDTLTRYIHTHQAHGKSLYIGYEGGLKSIALDTGIEKQRFETGFTVRVIAPLEGGILVGATDGSVSKISWGNGIEWTRHLSEPITTLIVKEDAAFAGTRAGDLVYIELRDGTLEWASSVDGSIQDLLFHEGSLCGRASDGSAFGVDPSTGDHRWRLTVDDSGLSPRIEVRGEEMYIHTGSVLVALDSRNGSIDWKLEIDQVLFGEECIHCINDGRVQAIPLLPDATTQFVDDRDEDDDSLTRIWRGD